MAIQLYYAPGACSVASQIALEEGGVPDARQKTNLAEGDQRKPEYLRLNPRGRVPTLVVDDHVLTENVGILSYFGGGYPQAGLFPKKTWDQAELMSTLAWLSNTVHPSDGPVVRPARYVDGDTAQEAVEAKGRENFHGCLQEIDQLLER